MKTTMTVALVAHDNRKRDLAEWVEWNDRILRPLRLVCTGTTGAMIEEVFAAKEDLEPPAITKLRSGPLGGDQQLGAMIAEGDIDLLIFLWDPMQPQPHDVDVKALLRIAVLYNVPTACNRSSADFIISSPLMGAAYEKRVKDYSDYLDREIE